MGIDTRTARRTGSDGGGGGEAGGSKEDVDRAVGVLKGMSSAEGALQKCQNCRGDHKGGGTGAAPGVCRVTGTSVEPATGSISAHPFSGSCGPGATWTSHRSGLYDKGSSRRLPFRVGGTVAPPSAMAASKAALRRRRTCMERATRAPKMKKRRERVAMKVYR